MKIEIKNKKTLSVLMTIFTNIVSLFSVRKSKQLISIICKYNALLNMYLYLMVFSAVYSVFEYIVSNYDKTVFIKYITLLESGLFLAVILIITLIERKFNE